MPGNPRLSRVGMTLLSLRMTTEMRPCWRKMFTRKRACVAELIAAVARAVFEEVPDEPPVVAEDVERDVFGLVGGQRVDGRIDRDGFQLSESFDLKRSAHGEIQVGNTIVALEHGSEDGV